MIGKRVFIWIAVLMSQSWASNAQNQLSPTMIIRGGLDEGFSANYQSLLEPLPSGSYKGAQGFKGTQFRSDLYHLGKDYCVEAAKEPDGSLRGTSFHPIASGKVLHSRFSVPSQRADGVGNYLTIDHGDGIIAVYMHLAKIFVKDGQQVNLNTVLGEAGDVVLHPSPNCGHLHLEIRKNNATRLNVYPNLRYSYVSMDGKSRLSKPLGGEGEVLAWIDRSFYDPETVLKARRAPTGGSAGGTSASPPVPYEDSGACPFECCTYRTWSANQLTAIRTSMNVNSPIAFNVRKGEKVTGLTGVVVTTQPGVARVLRSAVIAGNRARIGDVIYLLTNLGEGFSKVWFQGRIAQLGVYGDDGFRILSQPKYVWWVKIRNSRKQVGWTSESNHFDGQDACG